MTAIRALMTGLVDYAGLFPPASLDMLSAVRQYRGYLSGEDRWALGKFVVPAARLKEFSKAFNEICCGEREPIWRLSILASDDSLSDEEAIESLVLGPFSIDSIELKVGSVLQAKPFLQDLQARHMSYVEFAPGNVVSALPTLVRLGARAKIRTGGVTAEAFPSTDLIANFLAACARANVAFKATAGLHHAVRGMYQLTYERLSERALMHGFVNVFLAAVLAYRGENVRALNDTLHEKDPGAFAFNEDSVRWHGFDAGVDEIEGARREFAISYGSCSFSEPVQEVKALGWL
jgi:hypothetical protein